jgi:hypothetical protein
LADVPGAASELDELLELDKDAEVYTVRMLCQDSFTAGGDLHDSALGPTNQPALVHVGDSPMQPVGEQRSAARDGGPQIVRSQAELISDHGSQVGHRVLLAIRQDMQSRSHE